MFNDGSLFDSDIDTLKKCLVAMANTQVNEQRGRRYSEIAETIRHLMFLRQTQQAHRDGMVSNKVALIVACSSAFATIGLFLVSLCRS